MRDAFDSFLYRHWPRSFLLGLLGLFVAYGLWWLAADVSVRTYPQRVANTIPVPPGVTLVESGSGYVRKCKTSGIRQYFTTNESWDTITAYYASHLQHEWDSLESITSYRQRINKYEVLIFNIDQIDVSIENYRDKRHLFTGSTNYFVGILYEQDTRLYDTICKSTD